MKVTMSRKNTLITVLSKILFGVLIVICCYPVIFMLSGSFMGEQELAEKLSPVINENAGYVSWSTLPLEPTLRHYIEVFFDTPEFFVVFWNSIKISVGILIGQCLVSIPAAWGFAKYRFRLKKPLFFMYICLMMLPFQVIMLSEYLVLNRLYLLDTLWALILPGVFSTFPVFIIYNFFCAVPKEMIEAARIDGAGELRIFLQIGIPMGKTGITSAMVLGFLEYWNMIEQPMTFLKDKTKWTLSMLLPDITIGNIGVAFVISVVALIPALLVFALGRDYLEQGISSLGGKG